VQRVSLCVRSQAYCRHDGIVHCIAACVYLCDVFVCAYGRQTGAELITKSVAPKKIARL
jgi:hypothetical protein